MVYILVPCWPFALHSVAAFFFMLCVAVGKRKKKASPGSQTEAVHASITIIINGANSLYTGHQPIYVGVWQRSRCQLVHSNLTPSVSVFRRQNIPASCLHACFLVDKMYFISSFCTAGSGFGSGWNSEDAWPVQRKKWHNPWIKGIFSYFSRRSTTLAKKNWDNSAP